MAIWAASTARRLASVTSTRRPTAGPRPCMTDATVMPRALQCRIGIEGASARCPSPRRPADRRLSAQASARPAEGSSRLVTPSIPFATVSAAPSPRSDHDLPVQRDPPLAVSTFRSTCRSLRSSLRCRLRLHRDPLNPGRSAASALVDRTSRERSTQRHQRARQYSSSSPASGAILAERRRHGMRHQELCTRPARPRLRRVVGKTSRNGE